MPRKPGTVARSSSKRSRASGRSSFEITGTSRPVEQRGIPKAQFVFDRRLVGEDLADGPRAVHQMHEDARALDVAQEAIAEPGARVGAFDEAGHVDHDERLVGRQADDAELRFERRERIVRDFRTRGRSDGEQRRFAGVRQADHAAIRQKL